MRLLKGVWHVAGEDAYANVGKGISLSCTKARCATCYVPAHLAKSVT